MDTIDKVGTAFLVLVVVVICIVATCSFAQMDIRSDAVNAGVGEYIVVNNAGGTEFQWITPEAEETKKTD